MALYDLSTGELVAVSETTFEAEKVLERDHLQAALRSEISVIDRDLFVVAEEFGYFEGANRRIDLLCVDRSARLVVVELKRTRDGGHLELQALRYAAMVSTMTFRDVVEAHERFLRSMGDSDTDAEEALLEWMTDLDEDSDGDEPVLSREVRIVLVSAGFDKEITTTVLWLNDIFNLDIRCIRLSPYRHEDRLLLDVQQVIPLPEAEELTVQLRRREQAVKAAKTSGQDWTPWVITSAAGVSEPLRKRHAVRALVEALHHTGVPMDQVAEVLPASRMLVVDGSLHGDALEEALASKYDRSKSQLTKRYFLDSPFHEDGQTWMLSNQWGGAKAEAAFEALCGLDPTGQLSAAPSPSS